jgi:tight adherence protein B
MRRPAFVLLTMVGLVLCMGALPSRAADEQGVAIRKVDTQFYPSVSITVAVPEGTTSLSSKDVQVTENDVAVPSVEVLPWIASQKGIDVVLAIDTSGSMIGAPLESAIDAAKGFIAASPKEVRIGILTFANDVAIVRPITSNHAAARKALDSLVAAGETSLYDGVRAAAGMFSGTAQRNIVLLSDGGDTVSQASLTRAIDAAKGASAAVVAVGLKSPETDVDALQSLAKGTDGQYSPAGRADLSTVYADLATQLSNQYLVSYQSRIPGGASVRIAVTIAGLTDTVIVKTPTVAPPPTPVPTKPPPVTEVAKPFLRGTWGMAILLLLTFIASFTLIGILMTPALRAQRERELARRMSAQGISGDGAGQAKEEGVIGSWAPTLVAAGDRLVDAAGVQDKLARRLERAGLPLTPGEFVAGSGIAALLGGILGGLFLQSFLFAVIFALVGAALPGIVVSIATDRRMKRLHEQLPDVLMILASSLRAGHSFLQALDTVSQEIADPGAHEFQRVLAEIRLGREVDEAMNAMAERIGSNDFKWAVMAVNIQREVGGNLAEVLDTVADTVRERDQIRRQIDVLSTEGKWSMYILIALPIGLGLYMLKVNPEYIGLLFTTSVGLFMLATMGVLLVAGIFWMRKVIKIDV